MKRSGNRQGVACAILVSLVMATSGCGLLMTTAPPANHESLPVFSCTESNVGPGLDAVAAGLMLLNGALLAADNDEWWDKSERDRAIGINAGLGVLAAVSSGYGFEKTKACRKAKEQMMLRLTQQDPRPQTSALLRSLQTEPVADPLEIGERIDQEKLLIELRQGAH